MYILPIMRVLSSRYRVSISLDMRSLDPNANSSLTLVNENMSSGLHLTVNHIIAVTAA